MVRRLSIISDELDDDLETALDICDRFGVPEVELRMIGGQNWLALDESALAEAVALVRGRGFEVSALASPIFKCPLPGGSDRPGAALHGGSSTSTIDDHWALLELGLDRAASLKIPVIRMFSCWRAPDPSAVVDDVAAILAEALRRAERFPVEVALENEHDCNIATAAETRAILDAVPALQVIWDPGNHVRAGGAPDDSALSGYADRIAHVHLKDVDESGRWVPLGEGLVPYAQLIDELVAEEYDGSFSLETHCEVDGSRVAATAAALDRLRALATFA
jgi:sugar phosphate isomerase/epimerase